MKLTFLSFLENVNIIGLLKIKPHVLKVYIILYNFFWEINKYKYVGQGIIVNLNVLLSKIHVQSFFVWEKSACSKLKITMINVYIWL